MSGGAFAVTHHAFSSGAGRTSDGNGSHASTLNKGLLKNDNQLAMLFTLANLFRVDQMIRQGRDLSKNRK